MNTIVWTRAGDDWQKDLETAVTLDIDPKVLTHIPCVSFQPVPVKKTVSSANYIIFNSSNAVRFSMAQEPLAAVVRAAVKIFAIGPGTAETLAACGLSATPGFSGSSAKDLADQLLKQGVGGSFLIPTAEQSAFDTAAYLTSQGSHAVSIPCYRTIQQAGHGDGKAFSPADIAQLKSSMMGIICFASPSAVLGFNHTFQVKTKLAKNTLLAVAIGATTMKEVLEYFPVCEMAEQNSIRALLKKAQTLLNKIHPKEGTQ